MFANLLHHLEDLVEKFKTQVSLMFNSEACHKYEHMHGLRTSNEGINQRNLKIWADVADKMCFGRTYKFGIGI